MHGYYEFTAKMGMNSLTSGLRGPNTIEFADGTRIRFNTSDFMLGGTIKGDRTIEFYGNLFYEDLTNGLRALVCLSTYANSGYFFSQQSGNKDGFTGLIYESSQKPMQPTEFSARQALPASVDKLKDVKKKISVISGSWLDKIAFDNKDYWNMCDYLPGRQIYHIPKTPSANEQ